MIYLSGLKPTPIDVDMRMDNWYLIKMNGVRSLQDDKIGERYKSYDANTLRLI